MLYALIAIAVPLTWAMFLSRQMMLGFPCAIFWAILGGYCYTQSVNDWDIWYFMFFACTFGMTIFCILAAYALRERKDTATDKGEYIDEGGDEITYIDEGKGGEGGEGEESGLSERTKKLRGRAKERRDKANRRMRV